MRLGGAHDDGTSLHGLGFHSPAQTLARFSLLHSHGFQERLKESDLLEWDRLVYIRVICFVVIVTIIKVAIEAIHDGNEWLFRLVHQSINSSGIAAR